MAYRVEPQLQGRDILAHELGWFVDEIDVCQQLKESESLLFVLVYVPELTLWLPMKMGYEPVGNFNL